MQTKKIAHYSGPGYWPTHYILTSISPIQNVKHIICWLALGDDRFMEWVTALLVLNQKYFTV
jgi:hypothetical protein